MENQYELGNLCFGNSRGPFHFPDRELVICEEWKALMEILQIDNPYCIMEDFYNGQKRTNGLCATRYGGYICKDQNGNTLFELFPYWWNGCTCGADEENSIIYERIRKQHLSDVELNDYYEYCYHDESELNEEQKKAFQILENRMREAEMAYDEKKIEHDEDCFTLKHNFIYRPKTQDEFWLDWYKYPFRDSHMSKEATSEEVKTIFRSCVEDVRKVL